jgi:uncharacterized protein
MDTPSARRADDDAASGAPPSSARPTLDRDGLEVLDRQECLRLLSTVSVCRVGVTIRALPVILPMRFATRDGLLFVRCTQGRALHAAMRNAVVAVEADDLGAEGRSGWSVLVRGRSYEVIDPAGHAMAEQLGLPSSATDVSRLIAVHAERVSGRRTRSSSSSSGLSLWNP